MLPIPHCPEGLAATSTHIQRLLQHLLLHSQDQGSLNNASLMDVLGGYRCQLCRAPTDHLSQERLQSTKFIGNPQVIWARWTDW